MSLEDNKSAECTTGKEENSAMKFEWNENHSHNPFLSLRIMLHYWDSAASGRFTSNEGNTITRVTIQAGDDGRNRSRSDRGAKKKKKKKKEKNMHIGAVNLLSVSSSQF
jgi:hypothetical protein